MTIEELLEKYPDGEGLACYEEDGDIFIYDDGKNEGHISRHGILVFLAHVLPKSRIS